MCRKLLFYTESLADDERFMQVLKRIFIFLAFKKILPCLRLYDNYLVEVMVIRGKCNAFFFFSLHGAVVSALRSCLAAPPRLL